MSFIIILIALIIERFFHWSQLRHWQWLVRYQHFLNVRIGNWPSYLLLAICVLPPVIGVAILGCLMHGWWYGIPKIIFGVIILVYCLGPTNLWVQIYSCIRALNKEDPHAAIEQIKTTFGITAIDQPQAFHQAFTRAIFIAANQCIFAVLFWFAILGPAGAILYRAISLCHNPSAMGMAPMALRIHRLLDWAPVRVFTLIFALGGHFTNVFTHWKLYAKDGMQSNDLMLGECGIAALDVAEGEHLPEDGTAEKEALSLLDRVFVIGLVILALLVLVT